MTGSIHGPWKCCVCGEITPVGFWAGSKVYCDRHFFQKYEVKLVEDQYGIPRRAVVERETIPADFI